MKTAIYIDKGNPLVQTWPEILSDGSRGWDLHFRGGEVVHCLDEKRADQALLLIAGALEVATGEKPLIL